jgi:hypothetical protein
MIIGNRQRPRQEGNARITKLSGKRPGLAMIIKEVHILKYFEYPETCLHIAENACCIDHANIYLKKHLYRLWEIHSPHCGTTDCEWEDTSPFETEVAWPSLPIVCIHSCQAPESKIEWLLVTLHIRGW